MKYISLVEINYQGAVVIYGVLGKQAYFGYTKKEAIKRYQNEAKKRGF
ncbi:hypothetical protein OFO01_07485 [Campylobacter sp. JMF_01 NE2]|nr:MULTISPECIES: hypothetical protein [unclassified Campylobacter]MDA3053193.1 hypothetical protein [Campylobacter sp. JMF_03 NE3]MDA3067624.1 hypothetical protein [Campylobacter sp. JMF_01 NE2]